MGKRFQLGLLLAPFTAALIGLGVLFTFASTSSPLAAGESETQPITLCRDDDQKAAPCGALVEMEIRDVVPLQEMGTHAVVLVSKDRGTVLPIFVEAPEAAAIALRLAHRAAPQALPQDLLDDLVKELGGTVKEVRIEGIEEEEVLAHVIVQQGKTRHEFVARPSDSLSMAVAGKAKIFATRRMLTQAGISKKEIEDLRKNGHPAMPGLGPDDEGPGVGGSGPPDGAEPPEIHL